MSSVAEFKVIDPDGDEILFLIDSGWQTSSAKNIAEAFAEDEYDSCGGELSDPDNWPRDYKVLFDDKWVEVSVDMEYSPSFVAKEVPND